MKFPKILWIASLTALILYLGSYCFLSTLGNYHFEPSGKIRYEFGLAVADLEIWHPKYVWLQEDFVDVRGEQISKGNALGYFYKPLIFLDRRLVHKTIAIEELR